jgi:phospholipid-binding lipoprotein MlaA
MKKPRKGQPMRFIAGFLFAVVLAFSPTSLRANAPLTATDEVQPCRTEAAADQQSISGTDMPLYVHSAVEMSDTNIREGESIARVAQRNEAEEKMIVEPVPAENTYVPDESEKETPQILDPLAPVNRVMFHVNDKLYFWVLKPVAQGYSIVVPELVRTGFGNAYDNLKSPARIVNNLLQLRLKRSGNELIRFLFNSVVGVGGLGDVSKGLLGIEKQEADFGQTLGRYGVGHGLYLVLPILGPSSVRDGIGLAGDTFMYPMTYVSYFYFDFWEPALLYSHEKVNDTSFRIGDYEAFKQAAIDPYVSMRDAFVQYRQKKVEDARR